MEEAYDYYQYNYCITLYLGDRYAHAKSFFNRQRNFPSMLSLREAACIVYNKDMTKVLDWGTSALEGKYLDTTTAAVTTDETIYMDNFMNELHRIYPKFKIDPHDKDAQMVIQGVTDFLLKMVSNLKTRWQEAVGKENTSSVIKFHFVLVVPTHWEYSIREDLLRPIFIATKLISRSDHRNRLLFFTKLDSILQLMQHPKYLKQFRMQEPVRKSQQYLMCSLSMQEEKLVINLDSFELKDSILSTRSTNSTLIPRIFKSTCFTLDFGIIRSRIDTLLKSKVFDNDPLQVGGNLNEITKVLLNRFLNIEIEKHKNHAIFKDRDYFEYPLKKPGTMGWFGLSNTQVRKIESITAGEILDSVFAAVRVVIEENIRSIFFYNFSKIRTAILVKEAVQDDKNALFRIFVDWLVLIFNICGEKLNYKVMDLEDNERNFFKINSANLIEGAGRKMLEKIKVSDTIMPPHLIRRSSSDDETASSAIFLNAHPSIVINIDLSFKSVLFSCALLSDNNHSVIKKIGCGSHSTGLQSLENFFAQLDLDSMPTLKVKNSVITFMDMYFVDALNYFSKHDRQSTREEDRAAVKRKIKKVKNSMKWHHVMSRSASRHSRRDSTSSVKSIKIEGSSTSCNAKPKSSSRTQEDFFSHCQPNLIPAIDAIFDKNVAAATSKDEMVETQQQKYVKAFLVMYLGYVNEIVLNYLIQHFGCDIARDTKIGYAICIEKLLLNTVVGSKKDLRELLFASSLLLREEHNKKAQIIVQGEGLLPVLENNLRLDLKLKSYYVLAQINDHYIHFTLNQVVQTGSLEEQSSAIIIQDEIIPIDDMYELLCKNIWSHVGSNGHLIECCDLHKGDEEAICSLRNYKGFANKIKAYIHENYATSKASNNVNTEDNVSITIGSKCNCSIHLSLRAIVEVGFRPVVFNLSNIISSTLVNPEMFGKFTVKNLFILGNLFNVNTKTPLNTILIAMIQEMTVSSLEKKELEAFCFTVLEPIQRMMRPVIGEKPFMHDSFCKGCLHQVSRENYGLDFYSIKSQESMEVSYQDCATNNVNIVKPGHVTVLLQRGQAITNDGITRTFALKLDGKYHSKQVSIRLVRFNNLDDTHDNHEIIPLDSILCDTVQKFIVRHTVKKHHNESLTLYIMIKMKPKNHFSSLHFSAKMVGEDDFSKSTGTFVYLGEQLTLAYI